MAGSDHLFLFLFLIPKIKKLTDVIKSAYSEPSASEFHTAPFEEFWTPGPGLEPEHIYSELYNSNALIEEHNTIQQQSKDNDSLESVIMPIMTWSDATCLADFGDASLWPAYMYNSFQSKYSQAKPSSFAAHHIAYIPKLDDAILESYKRYFDDKPSPEQLTHLRRELIQAVWRLLLDDKFLEAYKNGIVILFPDGVYRRVFPRFFTYSADYPEKVLLTCIKFLENYPCTQCTIHKDHIHQLGTLRDRQRRQGKNQRSDNKMRQETIDKARRLIFVKGYSVSSTIITELLAKYSWTPIPNTFSDRLGLNFYKMFVVDLLHEFELGVWKATFTHLLRILYVARADLLQVLNIRYRQVPPFGSNIRRFSSNVSAMKRLAARDFEDLLQGELEHRRCKYFYPRVHKGKKHYALGVAKNVSRQRRMHIRSQITGIQMTRATKKTRIPPKQRKALISESLIPSRVSEHYQISEETRNSVPISRFLSENTGDPALKNFLPRLKDHILGRLLNQRYDGDDNPFSSAERAKVLFRNHTMFEHKTLRINYTTYDMRREQDTLNPRTNPNIMVLSPQGEDHPYWYAKIIGIFHVYVVHSDLQPYPKLMHFLWIRWYGMEPSTEYKFGWKARRLPRIGFVDDTVPQTNLSSPAFGFIDPANVIRAIHLIPAFHHGHTKGLLDPSTLARSPSDDDSDWNFFYVNIFADRNLMMRFCGGGVGHLTTRSATDRFLIDRPSNNIHYTQTGSPDSAMDVDNEESEESGSTEEQDEESGSTEDQDDESGAVQMDASGQGSSESDNGSSEGEQDRNAELDVIDAVDSDEEMDYGYGDLVAEAEAELEEELETQVEGSDENNENDSEDEDDDMGDVTEQLGFSGY
ncbi:hypothetical protein CVT24_012267 [Panaeolus cyanescens]|uniref:Uncharacterized protein n=1 Tax=Panaeolus cyanescens TaxID=181874 RepID=A0A409WE07_9AGAR|nr:hypothetical protein CVT24_012267 [Panaeolus cyanescens]